MDFHTFKEQCLVTEKTPPQDTWLDIELLKETLRVNVAAAELLDKLKKKIFYGKDFPIEEASTHVQAIRYGLTHWQNATYAKQGYNPTNPLPPGVSLRLVHGLVGAVTESGEIAERLLKIIEAGVVTEQDKVNLGEEFTDHDWYKALTYDELMLDENDFRVRVLRKLQIRAENDPSLITRDLTKEAEALNNAG